MFSKPDAIRDICLSSPGPAPPHVPGAAEKLRFLQTGGQVSAPSKQLPNNCLLSAWRDFLTVYSAFDLFLLSTGKTNWS